MIGSQLVATSGIEQVGRRGYDGEMISDGIRAFMARDWQRARDAKDAYWAARIRRLGPVEGIRIADELRRQALLQHPDWPSAASRREDLRHHARMTELLTRVDAARRADLAGRPKDAEDARSLWRIHGSDARRRRIRRLLRLLEEALGQSDLLSDFESIAGGTSTRRS